METLSNQLWISDQKLKSLDKHKNREGQGLFWISKHNEVASINHIQNISQN